MIMRTPQMGNTKPADLTCGAAMFYCWLMPYDRFVGIDRMRDALEAGMTVSELHDRLLDAEIETLWSGTDWNQYNAGWKTGVDKIATAHEFESDDEYLSSLFHRSSERVRQLVRDCYSKHVDGFPWNDHKNLSDWRGRLDCLTGAMELCDDLQIPEIVEILRKTTELRDIKDIVRNRMILDACDQALLSFGGGM